MSLDPAGPAADLAQRLQSPRREVVRACGELSHYFNSCGNDATPQWVAHWALHSRLVRDMVASELAKSAIAVVVVAVSIASAASGEEVARRLVTVTESPIQSIAINLGKGLAAENITPELVSAAWKRETLLPISAVTFRLNGQPISFASPRLWVAAIAIQQHKDRRSTIEYSYVANVRGLRVHRDTFVRVGYLQLTTTITPAGASMGMLDRAISTIHATEVNGRTTISHVLSVRVALYFRCPIVQCIANRRIRAEAPPLVDAALYRIESEAIRISQLGKSVTLHDLGLAVAEQVRGGLAKRRN